MLLTYYILAALNHLAEYLAHLRLSGIGSFLHFLVAHLLRNIESAEVSDNRYSEHTYTAMTGYDDLRNRAHADSVATDDMIETVLVRCLECWALYTDVHAMLHLDAPLLCYGVGKLNQLMVVSLMHVREPRTGRVVLAVQRVLWEQVDVVVDNHQVANLERLIHAARRIADEQRLYAELIHHTYRERNLLHGVAFVVVETAVHGENVLAAELSEDKLSGVSLYR